LWLQGSNSAVQLWYLPEMREAGLTMIDDIFGTFVLEDVFGVEVLADIFGDDTLIFPKWEDIRFPEQMPEYHSKLSYENPFESSAVYPAGW
jgi:hypothetical protein